MNKIYQDFKKYIELKELKSSRLELKETKDTLYSTFYYTQNRKKYSYLYDVKHHIPMIQYGFIFLILFSIFFMGLNVFNHPVVDFFQSFSIVGIISSVAVIGVNIIDFCIKLNHLKREDVSLIFNKDKFIKFKEESEKEEEKIKNEFKYLFEKLIKENNLKQLYLNKENFSLKEKQEFSILFKEYENQQDQDVIIEKMLGKNKNIILNL